MSHEDLIWSPFHLELTNNIVQRQDPRIKTAFVTRLEAIQVDEVVTYIALCPGLPGISLGLLTSMLSSELLVAALVLLLLIAAKILF